MQRSYKLYILSFVLLNIFLWTSSVEFKYGIPQVVKYFLSVSVLGIIIWYMFKKPSKPEPGGFYLFFVIVFVVWSMILIFFSIIGFNDLFYLQRVLGQRYFFIPYLLPLILLFTKFDLDFFGNLFYYSFLFMIPAISIQIFITLFSLSRENWLEQAVIIGIFDIGSMFLLFTAHISKKKYIFYFVLFYYLLMTFLWSFYGRRGMLFGNIMLLGFMVILRLRSSFLKNADRIKIYFTGFLLLILILAFGYLFRSTYAFQRGFGSSAFEESRGSVFETFFFDFKSTTDMVFGRGIDGTVLRSFYSDEEYSAIENGFLTILLKGGLLYAIPFVIIILRACYLGFFRSKNDLSKALASYLLIYIIMMGYFNLPDFSPQYIFVWVSVSACFTAEIRNHTNEEVYKAFNFNFR